MNTIYDDETYCVFEPSEIKQLALHATNLYFTSLSREEKAALMHDPVVYTTTFAKIYADTVDRLENSDEFRRPRPRR